MNVFICCALFLSFLLSKSPSEFLSFSRLPPAGDSTSYHSHCLACFTCLILFYCSRIHSSIEYRRITHAGTYFSCACYPVWFYLYSSIYLGIKGRTKTTLHIHAKEHVHTNLGPYATCKWIYLCAYTYVEKSYGCRSSGPEHAQY